LNNLNVWITTTEILEHFFLVKIYLISQYIKSWISEIVIIS